MIDVQDGIEESAHPVPPISLRAHASMNIHSTPVSVLQMGSNSPPTSTNDEVSTPSQGEDPIVLSPRHDKEDGGADDDVKPGWRFQKRNRRLYQVQIGRGINSVSSPKLLGEYQVGNFLGQGCYGRSYVGTSVNTNENVVLKMLDQSKFGSKEIQDQIAKEVEVLCGISNPNVASYKPVHKEEGNLTLFLEHSEHGTLQDALNRYGPLPEALIGRYVHQILNGLVCLHDANIVHRNLKCSNIIIKNGDCKISDLGVGLRQDTAKHMIRGSPYYMAPEIVDLGEQITFSYDIWSLGCIVVEMATGHPPNHDLAPLHALLRLLYEDPIPLDGLPTDMQDFVRFCFERDPKKRKDAKYLKSHPWILKNENAKKDIGEYGIRAVPTQGQAAPETGQSLLKSFSLDLYTEKDKEEAEFLKLIGSTDERLPTLDDLFKFKTSATVHSSSGGEEAMRAEIEALRRLNDENVKLANEMKSILQDLSVDQQQLVSLCQGKQQQQAALLEQMHAMARTAAHSNSLLKRTNQLASDAISKNTTLLANLKKLEEFVLEGDSGPKKLASLVYKKLGADSFTSWTLAGTLSYSQSGTKVWKKDKEKRGFFMLKDNFLFIFKNDKATTPLEIIYLGDGVRLSPISEEQAKRKHCFKLAELFLIAADSPEQYSEWMLALSAPVKWCDVGEDQRLTKMGREDSKSPVVESRVLKDLRKSETNGYNNSQPQPVFGVSLSELFAREGGLIPPIFLKMIAFLESKGLHEEGILRISGSVAEINKMKETLQHGDEIDFNDHDPHAVAGLLKCFLRELPEPLIPEPYHGRSLEIMGNNDIIDEQKTVQVKMIIDQLPPENHAILRVLMSFLSHVHSFSEKNKMTVQNLITCMVPTLKCVPGIFMYVIPNYDFVFDVGWNPVNQEESLVPSHSNKDLRVNGISNNNS